MHAAISERPEAYETFEQRDTKERADILIVDDDEIFRRVLVRSLTRRGLSCKTAQNADEALVLARDCRPRRVILDLNLGGKNGLTLIAPLTHTVPDCRIVLLTGYASFDTAIEAIKRGATHYLAKPADVDEILAAFEATGPRETLPPIGKPLPLERIQQEHIQRTLKTNHFNISATARALGMHRRTLQRKLAK